MNSENIKIEVESRRATNAKKDKISFHSWLFWKDIEYPLNFIGGGIPTISRVLGITEQEAEKLLIEKLEGILPTIEDEKLKVAIQERIKKLRHDPPKWKTELRVCSLDGCGNKFYPKKRNQKFCCYDCMKKAYRRPRKKRGRPRTLQIQTVSIKGIDNPKCPYCNGPSFKKGMRQREDGIVQIFKCYECRKTFPENYIEKRGANQK